MIVCPYKDLHRYAAIIPGLEEAMQVIDRQKTWTPGITQLSGGNRIVASEGITTPAGSKLCEAHRQYLDVQYIVEGEETVGWAPLDSLTLDGEFNEQGDIGMYAGPVDYMRIGEGYCYVVFPEDAHMPAVHLDSPKNFKKMVLKLKV